MTRIKIAGGIRPTTATNRSRTGGTSHRFRGRKARCAAVTIIALAATTPNRAGAIDPSGQSTSSSTPKKRPKYLNLRFDEDFSYLDGEPGSYVKDFADPIKNIRLSDDWRLTLGGEFRYRLEAETNKAFGATEPAQDTFNLFRYFIHADARYRDSFRVFAQLAATFDEERDLALRPIDENRWDIQQLFFDARPFGDGSPWTVRVGRQELQYGHQRFVSPLDWANVRRRFDGVKLFAAGKTWDVDLWWTKPVVVQRKQSDRFAENIDFYGLYATYKGIERHGLDLYAFALTDDAAPVNPNGKAGDRSIYTLGSRFWGKTDPWDYETELAGQWGKWAGDTVQAWSLTLDGGYTFEDRPWSPRLGAGFDYASGDDNARDGKVQTFDQLFPFSHHYLGFLDLVARKNVIATNVNLSAWPVPKKIKAKVTFHSFWLAQNKDALYNAPGKVVRLDTTGDSGREIGHELDVTLLWKMNVHSTMLLGYSHFWDSDFIRQTGPSQNADLFYLQYAMKF